jgi:hypothetical protein
MWCWVPASLVPRWLWKAGSWILFTRTPQTLEAAVSEAQKLASWGWKKEIYSELRLGAFPGVLEELDAHRDPYLFPVSAKL